MLQRLARAILWDMDHDQTPGGSSSADRECQRLRQGLRDFVSDTDVPYRVLEDRAGLAPGYLAQILGGNIAITMTHVLRILDAIGTSPSSFFRRLHAVPTAIEGVDLSLDEGLANVYGFGIESLERLRERLERYEDALGGLDVGD